MPRPLSFLAIAALAGFTLVLDGPLGVTSAEAQEVRRSAGARKSSTSSSSRRTSSGRLRGASSRLGSSSRTSRSDPDLPGASRRPSAAADERAPAGSVAEPEAETDEIERDAAPTLGKACIYGAGDRVVYRPKGTRCRGDAEAPARGVRPRANAERRARPARAAAPRATAVRRTRVRQGPVRQGRAGRPAAPGFNGAPRKKAPRKTSAGCLYDDAGVVLFEPATSDCVSGIGARADARRAK